VKYNLWRNRALKWLRLRLVRELSLLLLLVVILVLGDEWCYATALPVEVDVQNTIATLHVGTTQLTLGSIGTPAALQFTLHDPVIHEYQIDGTDSTNNFTLDTNYFHNFASSPYYRFQAWMRNLDGTSRWRSLHVWTGKTQQIQQDWPAEGTAIALPPTPSLRIQVQVQRPETPLTFNLFTKDGATLHITLDRNNRRITVTRDTVIQGTTNVTSAFFPTDTAPFAAMVIDTLLRTILWAIVLLCIVLIGETLLAAVRSRWMRKLPDSNKNIIARTRAPARGRPSHMTMHQERIRVWEGRPLEAAFAKPYAFLRNMWVQITQALHPLALVALGASFLFVAWIAVVQYNGEPHIFDASAYLFAAKMYALGHLSMPLPPAVDRFPGPFMLQFNGRWFGQYAPGTSLTLVPGIWLGVPWLVEPLLGTLALFGVGLIAVRLYNRQVATLAVILGTLSPFYTYLAASYLSHAIALFYMVWALWALLRFAQGRLVWNMALSAALFGMAGLTRDLVSLLFVALFVPGVMLLSWRRIRKEWRRWLVGGTLFLAVGLCFVGISLAFNALLTGSIYVTPRSLFFAGDHWGFGQNVGFYGQHTLAAGFVNLDELLTILAIDLFGWPFYLSFAFLVMPFLTRRAVRADWFLLVVAVVTIGAYIGYFYHGIYLGPRYLFETLPFLLMLTARGIITLTETGASVRVRCVNTVQQATKVTIRSVMPARSVVAVILVALLIACNVFYFMPRQVELHQDYTGLPAGTMLDLDTIYHPPLHNAIVVTADFTLYQFVLFPLNDPYLHNNVIYALASTNPDYAELHTAYPGRTLYRLNVGLGGVVTYTQIE